MHIAGPDMTATLLRMRSSETLLPPKENPTIDDLVEAAKRVAALIDFTPSVPQYALARKTPRKSGEGLVLSHLILRFNRFSSAETDSSSKSRAEVREYDSAFV